MCEKSAEYDEDAITACEILSTMLTNDFMFLLYALHKILGLVQPITKSLQKTILDLVEANNQIMALIDSYTELCNNDTKFCAIFEEAEQLCKSFNISHTHRENNDKESG